ncbi:unnamed protein product [Polarella glacialis]|uniref:Uncharacterized protein n=1 Tax=Polarella glacialis TaxID=89957 RepID=A0A813GWP4_POLGL|nr:unnamed protein product [Polarella glacialis]
MASFPRERLVQLIVGLLSKQGAAMLAVLDKKVGAGEGLEVKGVTVAPDILREALALHRKKSSPLPEGGAAQPEPRSSPTASSSAAVSSDAVSSAAVGSRGPGAPASAAAAAAPPPAAPAASARWGAGGARWTPGVPSASLLAAKALTECEHAEPCARQAVVAQGSKAVSVFGLPDVLAPPLGTQLSEGQQVEVVARFLSQRDGRVYLRLKAETGWVSTRSLEDFEEIVLLALEGERSLEPDNFKKSMKSPAMALLPVLDQEAAAASAVGDGVVGEDAGLEGAAEGGADLDSEGEGDQDLVDERDGELDADDEEGVGEEDMEDGQEDEETDGEEKAEDEETLEDAAAEGGAALAGSPSKAIKRKVMKFKIISGRVPILRRPAAADLMGQPSAHLASLQKGATFLADGIFFVRGEQRAYLRLTRDRGWICERSRKDVHRLAVVRAVQRRVPVSKKMAKAVAFRGGDAGGATHLKQEDLVKNSQGKIVSKRASEAAKKRYADSSLGKWTEAVKKARSDLGVVGFSAVKKGSPLYEKAQEYYKGPLQAAPPGPPTS